MNFSYQQTVVFDQGGSISIDVRSDVEHPMTLDDLSFVVGLAERFAQFEHERMARKRRELRAALEAARRREMPICWPGFCPP